MDRVVRGVIKLIISIIYKDKEVYSSSITYTLNTPRFHEFWNSLHYYSYNKNIPCSNCIDTFTDIGWGCCIRATQMVIAKALTGMIDEEKINQLFDDYSNAPLGIQHFNEIGRVWGPGSTAKVMAKLGNSIHYLNVRFIVYPDGLIIAEEMNAVVKQHEYVILFICQRLGTNIFNKIYVDSISSLYKMSEFVGIVGGDLWGKGYMFPAGNDKFLLGLDPHHIVKAPKRAGMLYNKRKGSTRPKLITWNEVNPTMSLVFKLNRKNVANVLANFEEISKDKYPPFELVKKPPIYT